jgi:hypothetical protein
MFVFPETPAPQYPLIVTPVWNTVIKEFNNGGEQRRSRWAFPKYDVTVNYGVLNLVGVKTLWRFYQARKGALEAFYIYDLYAMDHVGQYVAVADGVRDTFDLPGRSCSSITLYSNGVEVFGGLLSGGGDGDSDRINFASPPAAGQILSADFTGFLRIRARFKEDKLSRENFTAALFKYGIELKGLR